MIPLTPEPAAEAILKRQVDTSPVPRLSDQIAAYAKATPEAIALECDATTLTYAELWHAIRGLWSTWQVDEVVRSVFTIESKLCLESSLFAIAALARGRQIALIDPALPDARRCAILELLGRSRIRRFTRPEIMDQVEAARTTKALTEAHVPSAQERELGNYFVFTSGTTGAPKGIEGRLIGLEHFCTWQANEFRVGQGDRIALLTNPMFDVVYRELLTPIVAGATLVIPSAGQSGPQQIVQWLSDRAITVVHAVPSILKRWAAAHDGTACQQMRLVFMAGEPLTQTVCSAVSALFPRAQIINLYGPSETSLAKFSHRVSAPELPIQPVGRAMPGAQPFVFDQRTRRLSSNGRGELVIRTPYRSSGYLDPALTKARFVQNPCRDDPNDLLYLTGDIADVDDDGFVRLHGRVDDQVKISGVRIELAEISGLIERATGRSVLALTHQDGDERLLIVVVEGSDTPPVRKAIRRAMHRELPEFVRPHAIMWVERFPLTLSGKIDRTALLADLSYRHEIDVETMRRIWSEAFATAVGADDNFFDLGGDSLTAATIASCLHDTVNVLMGFNDLAAAQTPKRLVRRLSGTREDATEDAAFPPGATRPRSQQVSLYRTALRHGNGTYATMVSAHDVSESMPPEAINQALQAIVNRHSIFRQAFRTGDGELALEMAEDTVLPVSFARFNGAAKALSSGWPPLREFLLEPIALTTAPLAKAMIVSASDHPIVLLAVHHLIADGESMRILAEELEQVLGAGGTQFAPPADVPNERSTTPQDLAFWQSAFAAPPFVPKALFSRSIVTGQGQTATRLELSSRQAEAVKALASYVRTTPGTVMLCLFASFLAIRSEDFAINVQSMGSERTQSPKAVGCFYRPLPIRFREFSPDLGISQISQVASRMQRAIAAQNVSFAKIADLAGKPDPVQPGLLPLATTQFNLRPGVWRALRLWQNQNEVLSFPTTAPYEMQFAVDALDISKTALIMASDRRPGVRSLADAFVDHAFARLEALDCERIA